MKRALSAMLCVGCTALAFFTLPAESQAQVGIRIGRGGFYPGGYYGRPYYGGGYGYGPGSYYGNGIGIGVNRGFGAMGYGVNNGFYAQPGISVGSPSTYQSFYPPTDVGAPANFAVTPPSDGRGRIVVNVPANAEVLWNGVPSTLTGVTRLYGTLPLSPEGAVQKFEARWAGPDGQPVSQSRDVRALPNATVTVDFTRPPSDEKTPANN